MVKYEYNYQIKKESERLEKNKKILEEDTVKQAEMTEKIKKSILDERENCSKPSSAVEISSK